MLRFGLGKTWTVSSPISFLRRYATHRELRPSLSSRLGGGRGYFGRSGDALKKPLLFTAGFLAFNYFVLPQVLSIPVLRPLRQNPQIALWGIIGLNAAAFLAWRAPGSLSRFMFKYGLLQKDPAYFKGFQLLGSAFSHQNFWHIAINMFVLYQFGAPIANWMGTTLFLQMYLNSAVLSSLGSILLPILLRRPQMLPSLGASGAVFACLGVFSYTIPDARLALWFIPLPIGAWSVFLLTLGYNAFAMVGRRGIMNLGPGIDYAGHVAGSLCGIFYGWVLQKRIESRRRRARSMGWF